MYNSNTRHSTKREQIKKNGCSPHIDQNLARKRERQRREAEKERQRKREKKKRDKGGRKRQRGSGVSRPSYLVDRGAGQINK